MLNLWVGTETHILQASDQVTGDAWVYSRTEIRETGERCSFVSEHVGGHASIFDADPAGQKQDLRQLHLPSRFKENHS